MAESKSDSSRTLEMRVAEMEDKLAKLHVTDEEMRAYEKVAGLMGGGVAGAESASAVGTSVVCQISRSRLVCIQCIQRGIVPRQIVRFCNECTCGPCLQGGGFSGDQGGGFGNFGM